MLLWVNAQWMFTFYLRKVKKVSFKQIKTNLMHSRLLSLLLQMYHLRDYSYICTLHIKLFFCTVFSIHFAFVFLFIWAIFRFIFRYKITIGHWHSHWFDSTKQIIKCVFRPHKQYYAARCVSLMRINFPMILHIHFLTSFFFVFLIYYCH